jgi:hypothetical protein
VPWAVSLPGKDFVRQMEDYTGQTVVVLQAGFPVALQYAEREAL